MVEKKLVEPKEAYMKSVDKGAFLANLKAKGHDVSFIEADAMTSGAGGPGAGQAASPAKAAIRR